MRLADVSLGLQPNQQTNDADYTIFPCFYYTLAAISDTGDYLPGAIYALGYLQSS